MIKVLKSRLFIGGICLVLAAGIAFGLLPKVYSAKLDTVEVIKLRHNVSVGTVIDNSMLTQVEVGAYNFPETVVREVVNSRAVATCVRRYSHALPGF